MKKLIALAALSLATISATQAKADITAPIINCSSGGFALAHLSIDEGGKTGGIVYITLSEADDAPIYKYNIVSGLKDVQNGTSATVIARSEKSEDVSDAMTDSILIRLLDGQKRAVLSMDGTVYRINCSAAQ